MVTYRHTDQSCLVLFLILPQGAAIRADRDMDQQTTQLIQTLVRELANQDFRTQKLPGIIFMETLVYMFPFYPKLLTFMTQKLRECLSLQALSLWMFHLMLI